MHGCCLSTILQLVCQTRNSCVQFYTSFQPPSVFANHKFSSASVLSLFLSQPSVAKNQVNVYFFTSLRIKGATYFEKAKADWKLRQLNIQWINSTFLLVLVFSQEVKLTYQWSVCLMSSVFKYFGVAVFKEKLRDTLPIQQHPGRMCQGFI